MRRKIQPLPAQDVALDLVGASVDRLRARDHEQLPQIKIAVGCPQPSRGRKLRRDCHQPFASRLKDLAGNNLQDGKVGINNLATRHGLNTGPEQTRQLLELQVQQGELIPADWIGLQAQSPGGFLIHVDREPRGRWTTDGQPLEAQERLGNGPPLPFLANEVGHRHADLLVERLAKVQMSGESADRADADPRALQVHEQKADDFLLAAALRGPNQQEAMRCVVGVRCPDLLACYHVIVTVPDRCRAQTRQVRAGSGFGITLAPDMLTGEGPREVIRLLRFGPKLHQSRAQHGYSHVESACHPIALEFLEHDDLLVHGQSHSTVFLWPAWRYQTMLIADAVPGESTSALETVHWSADAVRAVI